MDSKSVECNFVVSLHGNLPEVCEEVREVVDDRGEPASNNIYNRNTMKIYKYTLHLYRTGSNDDIHF